MRPSKGYDHPGRLAIGQRGKNGFGDRNLAYSTDIAKLLNDQLVKFTTLNRHQLAGHVANLEFWILEVRHCLNVLDGYPKRFDQLKYAQMRYASEHKTIEYEFDEPDVFRESPLPPKRVPQGEIREARRSLCDATRRFRAVLQREVHRRGKVTERV